jgi:hypothetical protein
MNLVRMSASVRSFLFTVVAPSALIFDALGLSQVLLGADLRRCAVRSRAFRCRSSSLCVQITDSSAVIAPPCGADHGFFGVHQRASGADRAAWRQRSRILWTEKRCRSLAHGISRMRGLGALGARLRGWGRSGRCGRGRGLGDRRIVAVQDAHVELAGLGWVVGKELMTLSML